MFSYRNQNMTSLTCYAIKNNVNYISTTTSSVNNTSESSEDSFEVIDDINEFQDSDNFLDDSFQFLQFQIMEEERKKEIENNIATQLAEIRSMKHDEYLNMKKVDVDEVNNNKVNNAIYIIRLTEV